MTRFPCPKPPHRVSALGLIAGLLALCAPWAAQSSELQLETCRLKQMPQTVLCGTLVRPLNPAKPQDQTIGIRVAVLPAKARHKKPDPVFLLAGGPGQSAIELAAGFQQMFGRFRQRRDLVLIDQRGTGQSAPLICPPPAATAPLSEWLTPEAQRWQLAKCLTDLQALPHGDLRFYNTTLAMQDLDAVRQALGYDTINLIGASYGTRAGLEYMRLYPSHVRRAVFDGVAPADMQLPQSFAQDRHAALQQLLSDCEKTPHCHRQYPQLRQDWQSLLHMPAQTLKLPHPVTGKPEVLTITPTMLRQWTGTALYTPATASAWPHAVTRARAGDFRALLALGIGGQGPQSPGMAMGMHLSVICTEDLPQGAATASNADATTTDFGHDMQQFYQALCTRVPTLPLTTGFDTLPIATSPTLLLSGADDPATPPRHAQRVAKALGPQAHHASVPHAAHGTLSLPCINEAVFRFINTDDPREARYNSTWGGECAAEVPRPSAFVMPGHIQGGAHD